MAITDTSQNTSNCVTRPLSGFDTILGDIMAFMKELKAELKVQNISVQEMKAEVGSIRETQSISVQELKARMNAHKETVQGELIRVSAQCREEQSNTVQVICENLDGLRTNIVQLVHERHEIAMGAISENAAKISGNVEAISALSDRVDTDIHSINERIESVDGRAKTPTDELGARVTNIDARVGELATSVAQLLQGTKAAADRAGHAVATDSEKVCDLFRFKVQQWEINWERPDVVAELHECVARLEDVSTTPPPAPL